MEEYIKSDHPNFSFSEGYKQVFYNKPVTNLINEEIIRMRHCNVITDKDLKLTEFIYRFRFSTAEIATTYLNNGDTVEDVRARLNKLVKHRILNKFMLSLYQEDKYKKDALEIYCMDIGGKTLLKQFSSFDMTNWNFTKVLWSGNHVGEDLTTANFFVRINQTCPNKLVYFKADPEYRINRMAVVPSFEFCLKINGLPRYFVGQNIKDEDLPIRWRDKAVKLESILCTKAWMKYFCDGGEQPPVLFLVAENDKVAHESSKILTTVSSIEAFRVTTDERSKRPLNESGAFLKYDKEQDKILSINRTSIFDP